MFKNLNLNLTILIALFIGLALPTFFTTIYLQNKNEQDLKNKLVKTHKELIQTLSSGLSRPMWEFMYDNAKDLVEPIFRNEDILEIKVIDLKSDQQEFLTLEKMNIQNSTCKDSQIITLEESIILNKLHILGTVFIKFSTCKIKQQITQQRDNLWFIMGMQFLISFSILFLLINSKIISPIKKLIFQSNTLANKKLDKPFVWQQNDEIGRMGQSLEHTRVSLLSLFDKEQKSKEEIEELNKNLATKVKKEIELNKFKTKHLIQKSRLAQMGELLSMIAHQWRQPLTSISATANNLLLQILLGKQTSQEELKKEISLLLEYSQYLSSTIDDFRDFYKIDKEKKVTSAEEIIDRTLKIIEPSLKSHNIHLIKNFNCFKKTNTYQTEITQVILNLLRNSEDILILNNIEEPEIIISTYCKEDEIYIEIIDNGGGIKDEDFPKLFDPYFSTKLSKDGSGLGLYMSKIIIEDHCKGTISAKNNEKGATFFIKMNVYTEDN